MALFCGRIANKHILSSIRGLPSVMSSMQYAQAASKAPKVTYKAYDPPQVEDHDHKNMRLNRPMSPHLTIYAPQITSFTSIMHRMTGAILAGYAIMLGFGALILPNGVDSYIYMIQSLNLPGPLIFLFKFFIGLPFAYHAMNGIRHLLWDTGRFLTLPEVYKTANFVFIGMFILALAFAAM